MHLIDYFLIAALIVAVVFAVRHIRKKRGSCCGDCASCGRYCDHRDHKNQGN